MLRKKAGVLAKGEASVKGVAGDGVRGSGVKEEGKAVGPEVMKGAVPCHVGFIVDGNRRWAKERGLPKLEGHRTGFKKIELVIEECAKLGVKYASFFVFSTENWGREEAEVAYLMDLLRAKIDKLTDRCEREGMRAVVLGARERVPEDILAKIDAMERRTQGNTGMTVALCFNYGGQQEIVDAARKLAGEMTAMAGGEKDFIVGAEKVAERMAVLSPAEFQQHLYHPEVPAIDLMVRTSGEQRISGFMLWRAAYAEFLFLEKYFPEIERGDVAEMVRAYQKRGRRFGK